MTNETNSVNVPEEPTEEMLRAMLAVRWPATYRDCLRSPHNGPQTAKQTEIDIAVVVKQYKAALAVIKKANTEL